MSGALSLSLREYDATVAEAYRRLFPDDPEKSPEFLEYVLVHEMVHLIEHHHNGRFARLMDKHLPNWRYLRKALNHARPAHTDCA